MGCAPCKTNVTRNNGPSYVCMIIGGACYVCMIIDKWLVTKLKGVQFHVFLSLGL